MVNWNEYKLLFTLAIHMLIAIALVSILLHPTTILEFVGTATIIIIIILINYITHIFIKVWFGEKGLSKEFNINEKYITVTVKDRMLWVDFGDLFVHVYKMDL